jgi:hypothetical protein
MSIKRKALNRAGSLAAAVAVLLGAAVPLLTPLVSAAGQVQTRSIEMSDATPSQTGVTYTVNFTTATAGADSIIIDFCNDGSIIGSACTAPTAMDAKTSLGFTTTDAQMNAGQWNVDTASGLATTTRVLLKDQAAGANALTAPTAITFDLTGIVNSSTTGTFWARVYTYNDDSYGSTGTAYTTPQALGTYVDYGGFAMSTTELINITATVMETLTFCTSKVQPGSGCTATSAPNLVLGHGTPKVIDSTVADTDDAYFQISTNALTGAIVRMKSHNACANGGLSRDGGTTCPIAGIGALAAFTPATAQFGMHVTSVAGGIGTVNADADYDGTTATNYGMNGANVTSTYGDQIADTNSTAAANVNSLLTFAAQASVTTPAGVYSANESLIATGTF